MSSLFCCSSIQPYRPQRLLNESNLRTFTSWAQYPASSSLQSTVSHDTLMTAMQSGTFVIQLVRQVNFGPLESKRYFLSTSGTQLCTIEAEFLEITEQDLVAANYKKLNAYKNFKCNTHNKFFEMNVYEKDPVNQHHWRVNVARPGSEIDL